MSLRKTCPLCNKKWEKDPAEAEQFDLMRLRLADLVKGLNPASTSMEADLFHGQPGPTSLKALAQRLLELEAAKDILDSAQARLTDAMSDLAATPVAMGAVHYIQKHGRRADMDELEQCHMLKLDEYYAVTDGHVLKVGEIEELDHDSSV